MVGCIMFPLLKKYTNSIIDPLFYTIVMECFANAIPVFLYLTGNCSNEYFIYFILSSILFWFGVSMMHKKQVDFNNNYLVNEYNYAKQIFYFIFILYILFTIFTYIKLGIPLFLANRNDLYRNSGGLGVLSYFNSFFVCYCSIYSFYQILEKKRRKYAFVLLIVTITIFLGGSKSGVLVIVYAYFYYIFFYKKTKPKLKTKYIALIGCFPLFVIFTNIGNMTNSIVALSERFVANGDAYIYAYPNDLMNSIKVDSPIKHLLSPFLRPARLLEYPGLTAEAIGTLLVYEENYQAEMLGITSSPNTKIPIAGWIYFRWGGLVYSFILGICLSFFIYRTKKYFTKSILGIIWYSQLYSAGNTGFTDPSLFIGALFTITINMIFFSLLIFVVSKAKLIYRKYAVSINNDCNSCL